MTKELAQQLIDEFLSKNEPPEIDCIVHQYSENGFINCWTYQGLKQFIEECGTN